MALLPYCLTMPMLRCILAYSYSCLACAQGYPGTVMALVTYVLTREGMLRCIFEATADRQTPVNMVQHSYFNLAGHGSGSALDHTLFING